MKDMETCVKHKVPVIITSLRAAGRGGRSRGIPMAAWCFTTSWTACKHARKARRERRRRAHSGVRRRRRPCRHAVAVRAAARGQAVVQGHLREVIFSRFADVGFPRLDAVPCHGERTAPGGKGLASQIRSVPPAAGDDPPAFGAEAGRPDPARMAGERSSSRPLSVSQILTLALNPAEASRLPSGLKERVVTVSSAVWGITCTWPRSLVPDVDRQVPHTDLGHGRGGPAPVAG